MSADLATINSTLLSIKRDTAITAKRLSGKGTSAEEAREGLKQREIKRDSIAKPTAPKAATRKSGGGGVGGFFSGLLAKGIDWLKWFAAIGLGAFFFDEIKEFITAAFKPFKNAVLAWWDGKKADIGKAWEGVLDASGFNALMKGSDKLWNDNVLPFFQWFHPDNNKFTNWFVGAGVKLDKWLSDSFLGDEWKGIKNFLFGEDIHGEFGEKGKKGGIFAGVKEYARNLTSAIGKFGESLGLLDEKGNVTGLGMVAGVGTLATLFTFIGPVTLIKEAFKGVAKLGIAGIKTVSGLLGWVVSSFAKLGGLVLGLAGDAAIWGAKGATKLAGKGLAAAMKGAATGFLAIAGQVKEGGLLQRSLINMGAWAEGGASKVKAASKFGPAAASAAAGAPVPAAVAKPAAKMEAKGFLARMFGGVMGGFGGVLLAALAVAGIGAAIYGLWTAAKESRKSTQAATVDAGRKAGTITQKDDDKARAKVIAKLDAGKTARQVALSGAGSYEEFHQASTGGSEVDLSTDAGRLVAGKTRAAYDKKVAERSAVVSEAVTEDLHKILMEKGLNKQRAAAKGILSGSGVIANNFGHLFDAGVLEWMNKDVSRMHNRFEFKQKLQDYMKRYPGREITKADMLSFGLKIHDVRKTVGLRTKGESARRDTMIDTSAIENLTDLVGATTSAVGRTKGDVMPVWSQSYRTKLELIDEAASRAGQTHPGRPGGEAPGNVSVVDRSVNVSNATEFDYQFPAAREIRRFWME